MKFSRNLLYLSSGWVHPTWPARWRVERVLRNLPGWQIQRLGNVEQLLEIKPDQAQVLVMYLHRQQISPAALAWLEGFVHTGGGLLAIHSAAASFKQTPGWARLLGGKFVKHGPVELQSLTPNPDGLFAGMPAFDVRDERYIHTVEDDIQVQWLSGDEPAAWTRQTGAGRVFYLALGHTAQVFTQPEVIAILQRAVVWLTDKGSD